MIRRLVALGGLAFAIFFVAATLTYGSGAGKTALRPRRSSCSRQGLVGG